MNLLMLYPLPFPPSLSACPDLGCSLHVVNVSASFRVLKPACCYVPVMKEWWLCRKCASQVCPSILVSFLIT